jgi:hypothetical protein
VRTDVARNFVLQRPVAFAVLTGVVVVATSLGAGLLVPPVIILSTRVNLVKNDDPYCAMEVEEQLVTA